jgi:hypothetical protein
VQIIRAVDWNPDGDAVRIIDQRRLPAALIERDLHTLDDVCDAIRTLAVRGAPAIGVAGAMGIVVALRSLTHQADDAFRATLRGLCRRDPRDASYRSQSPVGDRSDARSVGCGEGLAGRYPRSAS